VSDQELKEGQTFSFLPWSPPGQQAELKADVYFRFCTALWRKMNNSRSAGNGRRPLCWIPVLASAVGMDKVIFKNLLSYLGLPVDSYLVLAKRIIKIRVQS
jgi:hypothetical protein